MNFMEFMNFMKFMNFMNPDFGAKPLKNLKTGGIPDREFFVCSITISGSEFYNFFIAFVGAPARLASNRNKIHEFHEFS